MAEDAGKGPDEAPTDVGDDADSGAPRLRIGCAELPPGLRRERFFEQLGFLETAAAAKEPPRPQVFRRWRESLPPGRGYGLLAPSVVCEGFARTGAAAEALAGFHARCEALAPEVVLFRTPPSFAPSAAGRDAMKRFFGEESFGDAQLVWEPDGLWELPAAVAFAASLGIACACDPLTNDPLAEPQEFFASLPGPAYFRVTGLGRAQKRIDDFALETLVELAAEYPRAWIVLATEGRYPDALKLQRLAGIELPTTDQPAPDTDDDA